MGKEKKRMIESYYKAKNNNNNKMKKRCHIQFYTQNLISNTED